MQIRTYECSKRLKFQHSIDKASISIVGIVDECGVFLAALTHPFAQRLPFRSREVLIGQLDTILIIEVDT